VTLKFGKREENKGNIALNLRYLTFGALKKVIGRKKILNERGDERRQVSGHKNREYEGSTNYDWETMEEGKKKGKVISGR